MLDIKIDQDDIVQIATTVFEKMPGGSYVYQIDTGKILLSNKVLEKTFGCQTHEEFVTHTGNTLEGLIFPKDIEAVKDSINEQLKNSDENYFYIKFRGRMKNGGVCKLRQFGHLIESKQYGSIAYVFSINDSDSPNLLENRENTDILDYAGMGMWHIVLEDDKKPRMLANKTMRSLLGIDGLKLSDEQIYEAWHSRIVASELPSVNASVGEMLQGKISENTYKWDHPTLGVQYVRCGGTAYPLKNKNGYMIRGYHYNVTKQVLKEKEEKEQMSEAHRQIKDLLEKMSVQYEVLKSMAGVYNSVHLIDLENSTVTVYSSTQDIQNCITKHVTLADNMREAIVNLIDPAFVEQTLEFTDLTTIQERLRNKKAIYFDFIDYRNLWTRASFVKITNENGELPKVVIFRTQIIDEDKRRELSLILKSNTDELTSLKNRHCFEEDLIEYKKNGMPDNLVIFSVDVNGLKLTNDSMGHIAGDELLYGTASCLRTVFGSYGNVYRVGGDEFIAIITIDPKRIDYLLDDLKNTTSQWSGRLINELSVSCGYAMRSEYKDWTIEQLQEHADKMMYDKKSSYYANKGVKQKYYSSVYEALCNSYTKVLHINVTTDTYQIIKMRDDESISAKETTSKISEWFKEFADSKLLYHKDKEKFLSKTNLNHINEYFDQGNKSYTISYHRLVKNDYKLSILELVPTAKYSKDNKDLYLYVKYIELDE